MALASVGFITHVTASVFFRISLSLPVTVEQIPTHDPSAALQTAAFLLAATAVQHVISKACLPCNIMYFS